MPSGDGGWGGQKREWGVQMGGGGVEQSWAQSSSASGGGGVQIGGWRGEGPGA
uniref:Uncharacterized protein n=1 Tax=Gallid alphaherpesvirus 2 TaxID=10390 RepID=Q159G2_9ALPH|nr:hypothetical protein MDV077.6 [Gallid alphaherpesvirus 2]ABG22832.1 hypothetical protein MDV077.6 [Gallid alphaherpesvirus 2]ABG22863.1 hypothetical protein MDV077.6 [Gallid alphaherpesvirus 2]ABG22894.1 hypothetical protein MDV077.6 [Gallid alphaherpesvirus 2]ABG22925.1 hypothetical protein MDV077.6 [Gallid alphaherpesvirus 2]